LQGCPLLAYDANMRNRDYKISAPGEYFHIYNRGNAKEKIFVEEQDFSFFLMRLKQNLFPDQEDRGQSRLQSLPPDSFSVVCYCLMPNHFHFLMRQNTDLPISKLLLKLCTSYSMYFNKKYNRVGHIFQDQFKQVWIGDNEYLTWLSAYIHQNPKVAGLANNIKKYPWSSYLDFIGERNDSLCRKEIILSQFNSVRDYENFVSDSFDIIKNGKLAKELLLDY
jgi:REP element-mobilizing transposase RayT